MSARSFETPRFSRAVLIYNPVARGVARQRGKLQQAIARLEADGLKLELQPTSGPHDGARLSRQAVETGSSLVIVYGGDGTINEVVGGMAGSRVPLMVLPGGTANVLAREIGLPTDPAACASLAKKGVVRRIALGRADERPFVLMAGIGVDAGIVAASFPGLKRFTGEGAYWLAGFRQLAAYHFSAFELVIDGQSHHGTFALISRAKNYGGSFQLTPEASLYSNLFEICLFQSRVRWRYLYYLSQVALGRHTRLPDVRTLKGRSVSVLGSPKVFVQVDGELIGTLPVNCTVERDALSLVVPPTRSTDPLTL